MQKRRHVLICFWFYLSEIKEHFFFIAFHFLLTLGPQLPVGVYGHSLLGLQQDVFSFGGLSDYKSKISDLLIYRLSCSSGVCNWSTIKQELKVGRRWTVAIPVPDVFCRGQGKE